MTQIEEEKNREQFSSSEENSAYKEFVTLTRQMAYENNPWFVKVFTIPITIAVILFVSSAAVMFLWNALLPEILGISTITYWQAMGIMVLCKILFGSFHNRFSHSNYNRQYNRRKELAEIWTRMTPDQKQRMKQELNKEWKNLTPEQRQRKKQLWKLEWKQECIRIKEEKKILNQKWNEKWNMTPDEIKRKKAEWKQMTPDEKQKKKAEWKAMEKEFEKEMKDMYENSYKM